MTIYTFRICVGQYVTHAVIHLYKMIYAVDNLILVGEMDWMISVEVLSEYILWKY